MITQVCHMCLKIKPVWEFRHYKGKPGTQCDDCARSAKLTWESDNLERHVYANMVTRCYSLKCNWYPDYGGRGIKVCERWLQSYANFIADMGKRPSPKHQLDRINNDGDYCPENCEWVTITENNRNKRNTVLSPSLVKKIRELFTDGMRCIDIARLYRISKGTVSNVTSGRQWADIK